MSFDEDSCSSFDVDYKSYFIPTSRERANVHVHVVDDASDSKLRWNYQRSLPADKRMLKNSLPRETHLTEASSTPDQPCFNDLRDFNINPALVNIVSVDESSLAASDEVKNNPLPPAENVVRVMHGKRLREIAHKLMSASDSQSCTDSVSDNISSEERWTDSSSIFSKKSDDEIDVENMMHKVGNPPKPLSTRVNLFPRATASNSSQSSNNVPLLYKLSMESRSSDEPPLIHKLSMESQSPGNSLSLCKLSMESQSPDKSPSMHKLFMGSKSQDDSSSLYKLSMESLNPDKSPSLYKLSMESRSSEKSLYKLSMDSHASILQKVESPKAEPCLSNRAYLQLRARLAALSFTEKSDVCSDKLLQDNHAEVGERPINILNAEDRCSSSRRQPGRHVNISNLSALTSDGLNSMQSNMQLQNVDYLSVLEVAPDDCDLSTVESITSFEARDVFCRRLETMESTLSSKDQNDIPSNNAMEINCGTDEENLSHLEIQTALSSDAQVGTKTASLFHRLVTYQKPTEAFILTLIAASVVTLIVLLSLLVNKKS